MRVLRPIVQPSMLAMLDTRQHLALSSPVACELICDQHTRDVGAAFQEFAEEFLGCSLVSSALHKNIEHGSVLVNSSPEVGRLALDGQEHLVEVPFIARLRAPTT